MNGRVKGLHAAAQQLRKSGQVAYFTHWQAAIAQDPGRTASGQQGNTQVGQALGQVQDTPFISYTEKGLLDHESILSNTTELIITASQPPRHGQRPDYLPLTRRILKAASAACLFAVTSVVTLMEIPVRPLQIKRPEVADEYEILLPHSPHLDVLDVTAPITRRAAEPRASHLLKPADTLQAATCLEVGATLLVTNDQALRAVPDLVVLLLRHSPAEQRTSDPPPAETHLSQSQCPEINPSARLPCR